jgi:hypothetical protein
MEFSGTAILQKTAFFLSEHIKNSNKSGKVNIRK